MVSSGSESEASESTMTAPQNESHQLALPKSQFSSMQKIPSLVPASEAGRSKEQTPRSATLKPDSNHFSERYCQAISDLQKVEIHKNSLLFANNLKLIDSPDVLQKGSIKITGKVDWNEIYNFHEQTQIISSDQQSSLNNDYDYMVTELLKIFLKQESMSQKHNDMPFKVDDFFETSQHVIETFKKLMKGIFPTPSNDYKLRKELKEVKMKEEKMLSKLMKGVTSIGSKDSKKSPRSSDKQPPNEGAKSDASPI